MRFFSGPALLSALVLMGGCTDDAIDTARKDKNDFGNGSRPGDGFNAGSTGDGGSSSNLPPNDILLTMEVPEIAAPDAEPSRRNLRLVQPDSVTIYATTDSSAEVPAEVTFNDDLSVSISFPEGRPLGPETVIEASFSGETYRSMAADADQNVRVNPFSEYLVRRTISRLSAFDIQTITDCTQQADCTNKAAWSALADQIHDFEIDIPSTASKDTALSLLNARGDFTTYIDDMMQYALKPETTSEELALLEGNYHTVFFGVELGQTFIESSLSKSGIWGIRSGQEKVLVPKQNHVYPGLSFASVDGVLPGLTTTILSSDVPYRREVLVHQADNTFCLRDEGIWGFNSHASAFGAATVDRDVRLTGGRGLLQSITNIYSQDIGWTRNPYYLDAYIGTPTADTNTPDRIVSSHFTGGKAIALELEGDTYKRRDTLEDHYLSVLDLNLERAAGFDLSAIDGTYNTVSLSMRLGSSASCQTSDNQPVVTFETGTGTWTVNGDGINESATSSSIYRIPSGDVLSESTATVTNSRRVSHRPSYRTDTPQNDGRLNFGIDELPSDGTGKPELGVGVSSPDGSLIAINLDNSASGKGILIAGKQHATQAPTGGRFRLQGMSLGMSESTNVLRHLDNATLTINSGSDATLDPRILAVTHTVSGETVSAPSLVDGPSDSIPLNVTSPGGGRISFAYTDVSGDLTLEGFFTADQNQIYLRLRDTRNGEQNIGLVLATRLP
ncbi:hypothetical protein LPB19_15210 [Marinobacter salinisoli]|uniref:Uncharacterized protein n=1 Tax=Marinobacter salinisoli TaxID=2769486 RepID=A0ABX7MQA4_9GAMM|nr:hypothetical protein [Marinobacter salinisoli]QSP94507.1 hypothetical protein LPB19_15210 [Marinobacter salinisoli]